MLDFMPRVLASSVHLTAAKRAIVMSIAVFCALERGGVALLRHLGASPLRPPRLRLKSTLSVRESARPVVTPARRAVAAAKATHGAAVARCRGSS